MKQKKFDKKVKGKYHEILFSVLQKRSVGKSFLFKYKKLQVDCNVFFMD